MDLDSAADELYALPPEEFIARRGALEKQARNAGDRDLAGQIRRLGKPTTVAWLANQLVRGHPDEIGPLLELGAGLRDATANLSGDDLRRLSQQQHQVIQALVRQAGAISGAAGHDLSDATARGLEETLRAALADGDLADALASARLTNALEHVGFGPAGLAGPGQHREQRPPSPPAKPEAPRPRLTDDERRAAQIERLAHDAQEAQAASDSATAAHEKAQQEVDQAAAQTRTCADTMNRVQQELDDAVRAHARSEREERQARGAAADSARAAQRARRRLDELSAALAAAKKG